MLIARGCGGTGVRPSLWVVVLGFSVLTACGGSEAPPSGEMTFRVDTALLGERYADSAISLRAPRGWPPIPDSIIDQAMTALIGNAEIDSARDPSVRAIFGPTPEGAMLAVSDFREASAMSHPDSVAPYVRHALSLQAEPAQFQEDTFSYHGFFVRQWRRAGEDTASFKLVLNQPDGPIY